MRKWVAPDSGSENSSDDGKEVDNDGTKLVVQHHPVVVPAPHENPSDSLSIVVKVSNSSGDKVNIKNQLITLFNRSSKRKVKVCVIGSAGVGRTSIVTCMKTLLFSMFRFFGYMINEMSDFVEFIDDDDVRAPQVQLGSTVITFAIFDICNEKSLTAVVQKCFNYVEVGNEYLIGNKMDLEYWRVVSVADGLKASNPFGSQYFEVSTLTGQHLDHLMDLVLSAMIVDFNTNKAELVRLFREYSAEVPKKLLKIWYIYKLLD